MNKLLVFLLLLVSIKTSAQFHLLHQATLLQAEQRKLIVLLKSDKDFVEEGSEVIMDPRYKTFMLNYNTAMQEALPKYWKLTKGEILFKTEAEVAQMSAEDQKNYIFLHSGWVTKSNATQGELTFFCFNLDLTNAENKRALLFECAYYPDSLFTKADAIFFTKVLNNHVAYTKMNLEKLKDSHNVDSCIEIMKTRTLLIDKSQSDMTAEDLAKAWEYKGEMVDPERIQKEIENESEDFLFVKLVWSLGGSAAMYDAFDTKTCSVIATDGTGGVTVRIKSPPKEMRSVNNPITGRYEYKWATKEGYQNDPDWQKGGIRIYKSPYRINKTQIKYFDSKLAQKINYK